MCFRKKYYLQRSRQNTSLHIQLIKRKVLDMVETGSICLFLSFVICVYTLFASLVGAKTRKREFTISAENGALGVFVLLTIASGSLIHALLTRDFSLKYVTSNISRDLPTLYSITAFWAGQAGSLLLPA